MAYNSTYSPYPNPSIFPAPVLALDVALLTALCAIQGKSGDEGDMQAFILDFLTAQGLAPDSDANGNITCTKGEATAYPCLVAHMDTVHSRYAGYGAALSTDGQVLYAYASTLAKVNENLPMLSEPSQRTQVGVGGDDRCGLYVALHLLTHLPACKVCFVVEEEIGMRKGSRFVDMAFFADAAIVLQCDRKGHDDWVQTVSGTRVSGDEFIASIRDLLVHHQYTVTQHGGPTDVGALKDRGLGVVAANMSCGYYNPHMSTETIFLPALENTLNLCLAVLERVGDVPQRHAHVAYRAPEKAAYSQGQGYAHSGHFRPLARRSRSESLQHNRDLAFNGREVPFNPHRLGWVWLSAAELVSKFALPLGKEGGFMKLSSGLRVGPYTWTQVKDYERETAENQELEQLAAQATEAKRLKALLKEWIKADGTWTHNKEKGPRSQWVKSISDGQPDDLFYPVAYAKLMADIPAVEKDFQFQWDGCYGPEATPTQQGAGDEIMFSAQTISKFVHEVLEEQAAKLAEQEARSIARQHQLPFPDEDYPDYSYTSSTTVKEGVMYTTAKKFLDGILISTTVTQGSELPYDAADHARLIARETAWEANQDLAISESICCPNCDTVCPAPVLDGITGEYFYCPLCEEWNCADNARDVQELDRLDALDNLDNLDGSEDDDAYARYLGKYNGQQWRREQDAYERAYGRD